MNNDLKLTYKHKVYYEGTTTQAVKVLLFMSMKISLYYNFQSNIKDDQEFLSYFYMCYLTLHLEK